MQLQQIFKNSDLKDCSFISEMSKDAEVILDQYGFADHILFEKISNKNRLFWFVRIMFMHAKILLFICKRSQVFVSTGGIVAVLPGIICFLLKKKIIYIETIAKTKSLTVTGRIFYRIADDFFVQDEALQTKYKKSNYSGTIYEV